MSTAFVLSGGGSLGAVQVGMLQALTSCGIEPDLLVGTSAGAMNAAWVAVHGTSAQSLADLAAVWTRLRRRDVFPLDARSAVRGLLGRRSAICSPDRLHELVVACAGDTRFEETRVPLHLVTADLLSGETVTVSTGPVSTGVLASAAIPGVFPAVLTAGRYLIDGGVAPHPGVTQAVDSGATVIYVLPTGTSCALPRPPASAIGSALHALTLLLQQRLAREMSSLTGAATIRILPPLCPLSVSAADFTHSGELIARARQTSLDWIHGGAIDHPSPERFLAAHSHRRPTPTRMREQRDPVRDR